MVRRKPAGGPLSATPLDGLEPRCEPDPLLRIPALDAAEPEGYELALSTIWAISTKSMVGATP